MRGRRGTWSHPPAFCVAGVALVALGWVWWRAWSPLVALGDIDVPFAWQAWYLVTPTCKTRGTYDTGLGLVAHFLILARATSPLFFLPGPSHFTRSTFTHTHSLSHNSFTYNSFTHHSFTDNSFTHHSFTDNSFAHPLSHSFVQHKSQVFLNLSILHHLLCLSSLPRPASNSVSDYWKKLTCGVIP